MLGVASDLFYWRGLRATGIDLVADTAGVAPTTLYRLFSSKDDLIADVERADRLYRGWFAEALDAGGPEPRDRILALFDALIEQVGPERCRGCPFQMGLAELPDASLPAHERAVALKTWVHDQLGELTAQLDTPDPAARGRSALGTDGGRVRRGPVARRCPTGSRGARTSRDAGRAGLGQVGPSPLRRADFLVPREQVMGDHGAQVLSVEVRHGVEGLFGWLDLLQLPPQV